MSEEPKVNSGIQMGGGTLQATNLAVGDNATINISAAQTNTIQSDLAAIRDLLARHPIPEETRVKAEAAVAAIAEETASEAPSRDRVAEAVSVLDAIARTGGALLGLGERLAPHLLSLGRLFGL